MPATAILLVDDHVMIRSALRALLAAEPSLTVVGEASDGREAIKLTRELQPDVVVMDVSMPDLNGIDATRQAFGVKPDVKVVGLSARGDERTARELLHAGAQAFVVKDAAYADLVAAIRAVVEGRVYFSPAISGQLNSRFKSEGIGSNSAVARLTAREREVLQLIAEGKATKEVAAALHISVKTAETHRRNIMEKLDVDSVAGLTKYAIREGLTSA